MMIHAVAGFLFSENTKHVALIKKLRPDFHVGLLNGIGGHVEDGEVAIDALIREFKEEAGVIVDGWDYYCEMICNDWNIQFYRAFSDKIRNVQTTTDEKVVTILHRDLPFYPHVPNLDWLIPMALTKSTEFASVIET